MSDIFICYSKKDVAIATQLVAHLQNEGWSVFIDRQTPVGRQWHREIEKELHAAKAVVVLWSEHSRNSDYVLEEAEHGRDKEILFPVLIESVRPPYGFGRIQAANLIDWNDTAEHAGLAELLNPLRQHLSDRTQEPATTVQLKPTQHTAKPTLTPGQTFSDKLKTGGEGPLMTVIPDGEFLMGSPSDEKGRHSDEGPQHNVQITKPFAMGVYAITFADYDLFCTNTRREKPDDEGWGRKKHPAINVSWHDAQAYCAWLSEQTGRSYRYPVNQRGNMPAVRVNRRHTTQAKR